MQQSWRASRTARSALPSSSFVGRTGIKEYASFEDATAAAGVCFTMGPPSSELGALQQGLTFCDLGNGLYTPLPTFDLAAFSSATSFRGLGTLALAPDDILSEHSTYDASVAILPDWISLAEEDMSASTVFLGCGLQRSRPKVSSRSRSAGMAVPAPAPKGPPPAPAPVFTYFPQLPWGARPEIPTFPNTRFKCPYLAERKSGISASEKMLKGTAAAGSDGSDVLTVASAVGGLHIDGSTAATASAATAATGALGGAGSALPPSLSEDQYFSGVHGNTKNYSTNS